MKLLRYLSRFREAYRALASLEARETTPRSDLEAYQLEQVNVVWRHASAFVPYYQQLANEHRLPPQFRSLAEFQALMPVLRKSTVQADAKSLLSLQPAPGSWKRTGGSTGAPMDCYWGSASYRKVLQARYRFLQAWGVDIFDRAAFVWGHSNSFLPGWSGRIARMRTPLEDYFRNRLRLSAYSLGRQDLQKYLRRIAAFRPATIYGYSTAIELLAAEAESTGFHCPSIKLLTLTGEPATARAVARAQRVFGAPAVVEYGSVECGVIASEFPDRTLRVREDMVLLETLPHGDGRFEIVVTILGNPSFPLLRYAIEDLTEASLERPGNSFAILKNVIGRSNDFILGRSGGRIHSSRFDALFKYLAVPVRRFRVRQNTNGSLSVTVELADATATLDTHALKRQIQELVEGYPVELQIGDGIVQSPAGKHRLVTSAMLEQLASSSASSCAQ